MQRRQVPVRPKPANLVALRDDEVKKAYNETLRSTLQPWEAANPEASLEEQAKAWRELTQDAALKVCGKRVRREEGWFTMAREELMEALAKRNRAEVAWRRSGRAVAESFRLKEARKELKRKVKQAIAGYIAKMVAEADGGARCY